MTKRSEVLYCPRCASIKIIEGSLDDGNNRNFFSLLFDPGTTKRSVWTTNQAFEIPPHLNCCAGCGLIWLNTERTWIQKFLIRKCQKEFIEKIFQPPPIINENGVIEYRSVKINPNLNSDVHCVKCGSAEIIVGRFYIFLRFRKGFNKKRYSLFFDPGHIKGFIFLFKRGVQIQNEVNCCLKCGCFFSNIDAAQLKEYITNKCKDEFSKTLYG